MRKFKLVVATGVAGMMLLIGNVPVQAADQQQAKKEPTGKDLAYDRKKGNCLACHGMPSQPDAESTGLYGPPLIAMSARFPDRVKLRAQIWDATAVNPNSSMPPMGKHKVLTEKEIDLITDFVYSL